MIEKSVLEKSVMTKEELNEFYNSQFEPMEFPWLSDVKAWIEKKYDVKLMTILYERSDDGINEFMLYFYSPADWNKIPLVGGQAFWCGHCAEIENIIYDYLKCCGKIRCRLRYTSFESSARRYLFSLLYRLDKLENEVKSLFIKLEPIYITLGGPIICVLETKEKAREFLLSEYYNFIRQKCFDLLKKYDDYNVLKEEDIRIFVDYKENKEKTPMYGFWIQEMSNEDFKEYEDALINS